MARQEIEALYLNQYTGNYIFNFTSEILELKISKGEIRMMSPHYSPKQIRMKQ